MMAELFARGVNDLARPLWALVTLDNGEIVLSGYAMTAKSCDLRLITWTLERSGLARAGRQVLQVLPEHR